MTNLTFIIAALNEETGIGFTLSEIKDILDDPFLLVVDGNSSDRTVKVARDHGAQVIIQNGEKGKGSAISQGLEHIRKQSVNTEYVIFIDADYTYPVEDVPTMVNLLEKDKTVGMAMGNRFNKDINFRIAMNDRFYFGNRFLAFMQRLFNGIKLHDPLTGLRVVRWDLIKHWKPKSKGFDIEVELNYYVAKMRYSTVEIPIHYRPRLGDKKLRLRHGFTILDRILNQSIIHLFL